MCFLMTNSMYAVEFNAAPDGEGFGPSKSRNLRLPDTKVYALAAATK
jgi:hypothetical protein